MTALSPAWPWPTLGVAYVPEFKVPALFTSRQAEGALDTIAAGLVIIYKQEIAIVGAIDTRFFIDTVRIRSKKKGQRDVASDAPYSAVVEHGWIKRARGQVSYPGRWPAGRAIVMLDSVVESAFSHQLAR